MNSTKHDLSFNHTKLDFNALHLSVVYGYVELRNEIQRTIEKIVRLDIDRKNSSYEANTLKDLTRKFAIVSETLHTLDESLKREKLEVINKPELGADNGQ